MVPPRDRYTAYYRLLPVVADAGPLAPCLAGVDDIAPANAEPSRPRVRVLPMQARSSAVRTHGLAWPVMTLALTMAGLLVLIVASH